MKITFVRPRPELHPYVEAFWAFESPTGFPAGDQSVVAPNGCSKLIIPYENSIARVALGNVHVSHERRLYFVGNRDSSTLLQSASRKTGFIAIEFCPHGAFPIFGIPMSETFNGIWDGDELFVRWGREVREALNNLERVDQKVAFAQDQLIALLRQNERRNPIVEYCVNALKSADGRMAIRQLAKQTGYSRRYLDQLFKQYVGLSPKVLAGIFRFQKFYRKLAQGQDFDLLKDDLYEDYYDQSHFIKEFKRMTGYPPRKFALEIANEFGRRISSR
jgi:AraC-like DNA-binding protein